MSRFSCSVSCEIQLSMQARHVFIHVDSGGENGGGGDDVRQLHVENRSSGGSGGGNGDR